MISKITNVITYRLVEALRFDNAEKCDEAWKLSYKITRPGLFIENNELKCYQ